MLDDQSLKLESSTTAPGPQSVMTVKMLNWMYISCLLSDVKPGLKFRENKTEGLFTGPENMLQD